MTGQHWPQIPPRHCILQDWRPSQWLWKWWAPPRWQETHISTYSSRRRMAWNQAYPPGPAWTCRKHISQSMLEMVRRFYKCFYKLSKKRKITSSCHRSRPRRCSPRSPPQWEVDQQSSHQTWWQNSCLSVGQTVGPAEKLWYSKPLDGRNGDTTQHWYSGSWPMVLRAKLTAQDLLADLEGVQDWCGDAGHGSNHASQAQVDEHKEEHDWPKWTSRKVSHCLCESDEGQTSTLNCLEIEKKSKNISKRVSLLMNFLMNEWCWSQWGATTGE